MRRGRATTGSAQTGDQGLGRAVVVGLADLATDEAVGRDLPTLDQLPDRELDLLFVAAVRDEAVDELAHGDAGRGMGLDEGEHRSFERVGHGTRSMARDARPDKRARGRRRERVLPTQSDGFQTATMLAMSIRHESVLLRAASTLVSDRAARVRRPQKNPDSETPLAPRVDRARAGAGQRTAGHQQSLFPAGRDPDLDRRVRGRAPGRDRVA